MLIYRGAKKKKWREIMGKKSQVFVSRSGHFSEGKREERNARSDLYTISSNFVGTTANDGRR